MGLCNKNVVECRIKSSFCSINDNKKKKEKMTRYLLEKLKEEQMRCELSLSGERVDLGVIISRPSIFLEFSKEEMEYERERHILKKKY